MLQPINLIITSHAYSHRKVGRQIADVLDLPFLIADHDLQLGYDFYRNLVYVGTMDFASVARFARYDLLAGNSVYYATVEGIPVMTPKSLAALHNAKVVAVSYYARDMMRRAGVRVDWVLHHAVKTVEPDAKRLRWVERLKKKRKMVTWISANQRRKGLDVLCEVARKLEGENLLLFVLTGPGEVDLAPLQNINNVHIYLNWGGMSEEELAAVYKSSDLVLSTSLTEGFGLSIAEGLAYGCKVLAPRYPPFTEYVDRKFTVPIARSWWELYQGYMWFEMRRADTEELARKVIWAVGLDDDTKCGRWSTIDTYKRFKDFLAPI